MSGVPPKKGYNTRKLCKKIGAKCAIIRKIICLTPVSKYQIKRYDIIKAEYCSALGLMFGCERRLLAKLSVGRIENRLDALYKNIIRTITGDDYRIIRELKNTMIKINGDVGDALDHSTEFYECCGIIMTPNAQESDVLCVKCGAMRRVKCVIHDIDNLGAPETAMKNKSQASRNHAYKTLMRMLGLAIPNLTDDNYADIEARFTRDRVYDRMLKPMYMRSVLADLELSRFNADIPYLLMKYRHENPPDFSQKKIDLTLGDYKKASVMLKKLTNNIHCMSVPYTLMKIIQRHFGDDARIMKLCDNIHMQDPKTQTKDEYVLSKVFATLDWKYTESRIIY
jgi:hypothetical protein